jgi:hypothetical protein
VAEQPGLFGCGELEGHAGNAVARRQVAAHQRLALVVADETHCLLQDAHQRRLGVAHRDGQRREVGVEALAHLQVGQPELLDVEMGDRQHAHVGVGVAVGDCAQGVLGGGGFHEDGPGRLRISTSREAWPFSMAIRMPSRLPGRATAPLPLRVTMMGGECR